MHLKAGERYTFDGQELGPRCSVDDPPVAAAHADGVVRVLVPKEQAVFGLQDVDFRIFGDRHPGWLGRYRWTWASPRDRGKTVMLLPSGLPSAGVSTPSARSAPLERERDAPRLAAVVDARFVEIERAMLNSTATDSERGLAVLDVRAPCVLIFRAAAIEVTDTTSPEGSSFPVKVSDINFSKPSSTSWDRWFRRHSAEGFLERCALPGQRDFLAPEQASTSLRATLQDIGRDAGKVAHENDWVPMPVLYEHIGPRLIIGTIDGRRLRVFSSRRPVRDWHRALTAPAPCSRVWPFESKYGYVHFPPLAEQLEESAQRGRPVAPPSGPTSSNYRSSWHRAMYLYACAAGVAQPWMLEQREALRRDLKASEHRESMAPFLGKRENGGEFLYRILKDTIEPTRDPDQAAADAAKRHTLREAIEFFVSEK